MYPKAEIKDFNPRILALLLLARLLSALLWDAFIWATVATIASVARQRCCGAVRRRILQLESGIKSELSLFLLAAFVFKVN